MFTREPKHYFSICIFANISILFCVDSPTPEAAARQTCIKLFPYVWNLKVWTKRESNFGKNVTRWPLLYWKVLTTIYIFAEMDRAELVVKLQTAQINLEQEQERRRRLEAKVDSFTRQRQTSSEGMEDLKVKLNKTEASEARERQAGSKLREDLSQLQKNNEDLEARMKQVLTKSETGFACLRVCFWFPQTNKIGSLHKAGPFFLSCLN